MSPSPVGLFVLNAFPGFQLPTQSMMLGICDAAPLEMFKNQSEQAVDLHAMDVPHVSISAHSTGSNLEVCFCQRITGIDAEANEFHMRRTLSL